ncbi:DNA polymerase kappa [Termitomyces sp. J132]|nr:DNA polymerase kappa [Termitomyces sp. J132]
MKTAVTPGDHISLPDPFRRHTSLPQSGNIVEPVASQDTTSLVNRLAGPSTGKAGLAQDQTEINRIIAEASKGSKFYYNEKKKDKDLTQRIEKILQLRDDILRGVDLRNVEHFVDRLISELESERDLSQTIVHVDMDAFYANVELLDNPDLAGKPFGVGHGMLCTASYEARKYGVRSGMPGFIATKLCPGLIFVPLHHSRYTELSEVVMSVLCRYDPTFFAAGCDEAYLNITNYCKTHGLRATQCVQELREAVFKETKLTASAGIAPTKMLAKVRFDPGLEYEMISQLGQICSDKNKPNGQFELSFDSHSILSFLRDLSIRKVPGVGRVNERLLESIGIKANMWRYIHPPRDYLPHGQTIWITLSVQNLSRRYIECSQAANKRRKKEHWTFAPCRDKVQILDKLNEIAVELEKDMTENGWAGRTVTLKCKLDTYQVFTRAQSFHRWLIKKEDLFAIGKELIVPEFPLTVRLIGLRVTNLKDLRAPPDPVIGIKHFFESLKDIQCCKRIRTDLNHRECDADPMASHEVSDDVLDEAMSDFHETDKNVTYLNFEGHTTADDPEEDALISLDTTPQTHSVASSEKLRLAPHVKLKRDASYSVSVKPPSKGTIGPSISSETVDEEGLNDCPICGKTLRTDNQGLNSHVDFCLSRAAIRQAHAEATNIVKAPTVSFKPISKGKGKSKK